MVLTFSFEKSITLFHALISSNINEVIKTVLNLSFFFFFFFDEKISHAPKSTKKHKKHQKHRNHKNITKQKHKNANKRTKIKIALKKHLRGKKYLFAYLRTCACEEKSLYNGNVAFTKLVKVLSAL